jgi:putative ABC transport system permease protein
MDAILQKIKADITSRPLVSGLIIVTIMAASTLLTLALVTLMNISAPYDQSFEELNGAHLWLHFDRDRIRMRDIRRIESLPGVVASTGLRYSVRSRVRLGDKRVWTSLRAMPETMPPVNRLLIRQGRYLMPDQAEILASKDLNDLYKLAVGDEVGITLEDGQERFLPVIGLAYNPMWDTYRNTQPPYLYLNEETLLEELFPNKSSWDWSLGLRLANPEAVDEMLAQIESILRSGAIDNHTDWRDVRSSAIFAAQLNFVFLGAFSLFAIMATVLVVASSISSIVLSQFKQIGMLKAIGFTQHQILALYLGQYVALSLVGSPLGLLLGIILSPLPLESVAASLNTRFQPPLNILLVVLVFSIVPGIVIIATMGAAYRGARTNIIKAIATGAEAPHKKSLGGGRLAARLNLPVTFILGMDDVFAKPLRSFMTGLNLTLGVIGIVFGLALNQTLETYRATPSLLGIPYDAVVSREETSDGRTRHLLDKAPGVAAYYSQALVEVKTENGQPFQVRAVDGNLAAFPFKITRGRFFEPYSHEAIAGRGLLDWLDLEIGDEITLLLEDRPVTWQIVGQYPESANAGQMLMVSLPTVARFMKDAKPETYHLKLTSDFEMDRLRQYLEPTPGSDLNLMLAEEGLPSSIVYLQVGVFALAGILIGIALVNVFNTSLLAMQEKLRVIGVLKTVGMTPGQVMMMVNTTAGILGFLAVVIGVPLGLAFAKGLFSALSEIYGFGEVYVSLNLLYVAALIPMMVGISMLGSLIPGRQAAHLSIVRVLRNE